jgi:elongator complex protein 3
MRTPSQHFQPELHEPVLVSLIEELRHTEGLDPRSFDRILRRHPKNGKGAFKKSEIVQAYRRFAPRYGWQDEQSFMSKVRSKPVRTDSGVAPVTVLSKPFPCPGRCVFCPSDVRMPKSYLSMEPGAQRAAHHRFDPFSQTSARLQAFANNGHAVGKIELIVLGGTWSFYPESYQIWFVERCLAAMNTFGRADWRPEADRAHESAIPFEEWGRELDGRALGEGYNAAVSKVLRRGTSSVGADDLERSHFESLCETQRENEDAKVRCVGLVLETRPDYVDEAEVIRLRRLGATKIQLGIQSLSDPILTLNQRGHDVAATRRAMRLLREAGFKIHAHWMPNLLGATPESDREDFERLFEDPDFRPDELKIYPNSLIESAELMVHYEAGRWRPYTEHELIELIVHCMARTPAYCRLTRVIRDIPGHDIVVGNRCSNMREIAEALLDRRGLPSVDIRSREIRGRSLDPETLQLEQLRYQSSAGEEVFLQFVTPSGGLAGFLRLSLPHSTSFVAELGRSAVIREVHVYGQVADPGEASLGRAQHAGLGTRLIEAAADLARQAGFSTMAVISAIGTRSYYRRLGFTDGALYLHRGLELDWE